MDSKKDTANNSKKRKLTDNAGQGGKHPISSKIPSVPLLTKSDTKAFLDDLFSSLPAKKKRVREEAAAAEQAHLLAAQAKLEQIRAEKAHIAALEMEGQAANRIRAPDSPIPLRVDKDGLPIFDEKTLGVGDKEGKFTKDCPFDCFCCFG
jgi:hypothetical protein